MSQSNQKALARIEQGIEAARESKRFREYLAFCGRFYRYSVANQLLIWTQRPTATLVAGFRTWSTMRRYVRKGEKGILILAPVTPKRKVDDDDDELEEAAAVRFRPVHVFDASQTEGDELPSPVDYLRGDDGGLWRRLEVVATAEGLLVSRDVRPTQIANGFYSRSDSHIWVSPTLEPLQAAKTLAHELSHHFARHKEKSHGREDAEMIAESSAFVVMARLGCDSGDYSFGYLASWGDVKLFRARLQEIHDTAGALISALEAANQDPRQLS